MDKNLTNEIDNELVLYEKQPNYDSIIDNIYIGNYATALDLSLLKSLGITHILVVGKNMKELFVDEFIYKTIPLYDSDYTNITKYFDESNEFIRNGYEKGKILIHCGHGISRSVSLVMAYLIKCKEMSYSEVKLFVKSKRKVAQPNPGFEKQLKDYSYNILKKF
jgi:protein-tyrosine phosphatase